MWLWKEECSSRGNCKGRGPEVVFGRCTRSRRLGLEWSRLPFPKIRKVTGPWVSEGHFQELCFGWIELEMSS